MKRILASLLLLLSFLASPATAAQPRFYLRLMRPSCLFINAPAPQQQQADPRILAALDRIADQQQAMALQFQLLQQQARPVPSDPQMVALLQQLASQQDRILAAIQSGKTDPQLVALLQQMISGQQQLLLAIQNQKPATPAPPIVVIPPGGSNPGTVPPGGATPGLPPAGGALQVLPGPGGSLQVLPPAGGSLQAVPGPGGSIQLLPGVKPPDGVAPPAGGATPSVPGGGATPSLPGAGGGIQIIPVNPDLSPIPPGDRGTVPVKKPLVPHRYATAKPVP